MTQSDTTAASAPLADEELRLLDAYWRAANYLSVAQIYLLGNPLLREPLQTEHVKPRLVGHFGTMPGLRLLYVHLNRQIRARELSAIYVTGPGHGGPALVVNAYLEGTYCELYPNIGRDEAGLKKLFRQFSFPGGIPSHVAPEVPGSIHEGGELGYALIHAFGAAFDNPELLVACVIVMVGHPERKSWWRNLRHDAPVEVRLRGRRLVGRAAVSADPAVASSYLERYPRARAAFVAEPEPTVVRISALEPAD